MNVLEALITMAYMMTMFAMAGFIAWLLLMIGRILRRRRRVWKKRRMY